MCRCGADAIALNDVPGYLTLKMISVDANQSMPRHQRSDANGLHFGLKRLVMVQSAPQLRTSASRRSSVGLVATGSNDLMRRSWSLVLEPRLS